MDVERQIRALWCIDSISGREYLINLQTQEIIAERVNGRIVDPSPPEIQSGEFNG